MDEEDDEIFEELSKDEFEEELRKYRRVRDADYQDIRKTALQSANIISEKVLYHFDEFILSFIDSVNTPKISSKAR